VIAVYREYYNLYIGDKLRLYSKIYEDDSRPYQLFLCGDGKGHYVFKDDERYKWVVEFHEAIENYGIKVVIDGELLNKCLDLYNLLKYRYEASLNNVYNGNIVKTEYHESDRYVAFVPDNNIVIVYSNMYKVSDDFMARSLQHSGSDIATAIYAERGEIWLNAFPAKAKSARNRCNE
jgi:hypothetical protein